MTEQELIDQMVSLTANARSVMQGLQTYANQNTDVTFTIGGVPITLPSLPKQIASNATQQAADRLAFHKDFGGAVSSLTLTRDAAGRISGTAATFASGWTMTHDYTRNSYGRLATIAVVIKNESAVTQASFTKTVTYDASNHLASIA